MAARTRLGRGGRVLWALVAAALAALGTAEPARAAIHVVTTTEDLAALAREVGGPRVDVAYLAHGYEDPHFVDAKPSLILKLKRADLFIEVGRDLEIGWAPPLLNNARNPKILPGSPGFLDASSGVRILEVPTGQVSRAQGDVHPYGNPHFWLDVGNARIIAREIRDKLASIDPAGRSTYAARFAAFDRRLTAAERRWQQTARAIGLTGARIVTYHNSWPYFARERVKVLVVEPYFDPKLPAKIARATGAAMVVLPPSVDEKSGIRTYFDLIDRQLALLGRALGRG